MRHEQDVNELLLASAKMGAMTRPSPPDAASRDWLRDLRAEDPVRAEAVTRLRGLLLRAARFEVARRRPALPQLGGAELDELAQEAADDATVSVLRRLDDFRGESRFTTWAYKFALLEAAVKVRRRAWRGRELPVEPEAWGSFEDRGAGPEERAERALLLGAIRDGIETALTPHQRQVLVALALDGVPIDVLADRLGTNRNALYKSLHDARRRLRAHLAKNGFASDGFTDAGSTGGC
jgi:RNA polymerase sigma-70 factor (ECF subfamily)